MALISRNEFINNIINRLKNGESVSIHYESEDGDITNHTFYYDDDEGSFMHASDFRGLNDNGSRYLVEYDDEPITFSEIFELIFDPGPDGGDWFTGYCNVDCDL